MTDSRLLGAGAFGPDPDHDHELGGLLRDVVGDAPTSVVNWTALAARVSERIGVPTASPWWMYAMQWERRVIPLALAAGIAAAAALWPTAPPSPTRYRRRECRGGRERSGACRCGGPERRGGSDTGRQGERNDATFPLHRVHPPG